MTSEKPVSSIKGVGETGNSGALCVLPRVHIAKFSQRGFLVLAVHVGTALACAAPAEAGLLQGSSVV